MTYWRILMVTVLALSVRSSLPTMKSRPVSLVIRNEALAATTVPSTTEPSAMPRANAWRASSTP